MAAMKARTEEMSVSLGESGDRKTGNGGVEEMRTGDCATTVYWK